MAPCFPERGSRPDFLIKNIPVGADPLDSENILGFVSGALTGTGALLCSRWTVACKSPLTGLGRRQLRRHLFSRR